jgi:hypothetical protein
MGITWVDLKLFLPTPAWCPSGNSSFPSLGGKGVWAGEIRVFSEGKLPDGGFELLFLTQKIIRVVRLLEQSLLDDF